MTSRPARPDASISGRAQCGCGQVEPGRRAGERRPLDNRAHRTRRGRGITRQRKCADKFPIYDRKAEANEDGTAFSAVAPSWRLGAPPFDRARFVNGQTRTWFQANHVLRANAPAKGAVLVAENSSNSFATPDRGPLPSSPFFGSHSWLFRQGVPWRPNTVDVRVCEIPREGGRCAER